MNKPITRNPAVFGNTPVLRGTRIRPSEITMRCRAGETTAQIIDTLNVTEEQIRDALKYQSCSIEQMRAMIEEQNDATD